MNNKKYGDMRCIKNRKHINYMSFDDLGLSDNLLRAIKDCGYTEPTPIQAQAIPNILMMRDLVGLAQTGTGKTAAFTMPMIEILDGGRARARMPRSLILAPTRELAAQVAENFELYGKYTKLNMALLTGGTNMQEQIKLLDRGVDVLIATPGRLLDLFERGRILLTGVKVLVIDEADRMLDMGFIPDIEKIVSLLSPMRQTLLFSATMAPEIKKLTTKFLSNPKEVSVAPPASPAKNVEQFVVRTSQRNKNNMIRKIIQREDIKNAFVFCNRKRDVDMLAKWLSDKGYNARGMHGDMDQNTRTKTLEDFKNGDIRFLCCSDVAGRGIDVSDLSHVLNYDVPFNADDYVHRIGRTGRAGQSGRAWMLVTDRDDKFIDAVHKKIKKVIEVVDLDSKSDSKDGGKAPQKQARNKTGAHKSAPKKSKERLRGTNPASNSGGNMDKTPRYADKPSNEAPSKKQESDDVSAHEDGFGDDVPAFLR